MVWPAYIPRYVLRDLLDHPETSPVEREQRHMAITLFADISGFTAISETLGHEGTAGTEELSGLLNGYFTPLIAMIHAHGGSITNFGGDALSVVFVETPATRQRVRQQAIQCALAMQASTADRKAQIAGGKTFDLRLKIGLAAGQIILLSVGVPGIRLQPLVAGRTLAHSATAQRQAAAGEVVLHQSMLPVAQLVPGRQSAECTWVTGLHSTVEPAPLPELPPIPARLIPVLATYMHPTILQRLEHNQAAFINEHRKVTILFVQFRELDEDDPALVPTLHTYFEAVINIIQRYGGYLNEIDLGDKGSSYLILFGTPISHAQDAERALQCALELRSLDSQTTAIGIHSGFVYCGMVGSAASQEYTVIGDAVNLAARLMQSAQPGQIIVSNVARLAAGSKFTWELLDPLILKGRTEPTAVAALSGLSRIALSFQEPSYHLPMVGRQAELAQVVATLPVAQQGQGQIIGISAEGGMGKSRFSAEIQRVASSAGFAVYGGACVSYGTHISYLVWHTLLAGLFEIDPGLPLDLQAEQLAARLANIDPQFEIWGAVLGTALRLAIPDNEQTALFDSKMRKTTLEALVIAALTAHARQNPLVLVFEDCHWIDPLSLDLLELLAAASANLPIVLLLIYRPVEIDGLYGSQLKRLMGLPNWSEIQLAEFSIAEAAQLMRLRLAQLTNNSQAVSAAVVEQMALRAGGNPFYLEELINLLHDRQLDPSDPASLLGLELPDSLHQLIMTRIDQLDEGIQRTVKTASILGRQFKAAWLWGAYPELGSAVVVMDHLAHLNRLDLTPIDRIEPELEYVFKHVITQEVAYQSLSFATRAQLHDQLAQFLEQTYPQDSDSLLELLAYHYGRSQNSGKQRVYFRRAAESAQAVYANSIALEYYERLLPLLDPSEHSPILIQMSMILHLVGRWDESTARAYEALALARAASDQTILAQAHRRIGAVHSSRGEHRLALEQYQIAIEQARLGGDQPVLLDLLLRRGWILARMGDLATTLAIADETAHLSRALDLQAEIAMSHKLYGFVYTHTDDYMRGRQHQQQALAIYRAIHDLQGEASMLNILGENHRHQADFGPATELYQQALVIIHQLQDREREMLVLSNMAGCALGLSQHSEAETMLRKVLVMAEGQHWFGLSETYQFLSEAVLGQGRAAEALDLALLALQVGQAIEMRSAIAGAWRSLGRCLAGLDAATPAAAPQRIQIDDTTYAWEECFKRAHEVYTEIDAKTEIARTLRVWAPLIWQAGDHQRAIRLWDAALTLFQQLGLPREIEKMEQTPFPPG